MDITQPKEDSSSIKDSDIMSQEKEANSTKNALPSNATGTEDKVKDLSDELKTGEIKIKSGLDDEDSLVIDEAGDEDTKGSDSNMAPGSEGSGGENEEREFEPTIDMIMNDFDDEQTMEEEEALESQEDNDDEINALNEEQDMPLEELMKLYGGYGGAQPSPPTHNDGSKKKGKKKKKKHKKAQEAGKDDGSNEIQPEKANQEEDKNKESIENSESNALDNPESSNGVALQVSDDEDNDQDEELDEEDDDLDDADDDEDSNLTHKRAVRDDQEQMSTDGQQISNSDPSSPPPAKKSRQSELARFYEAAVKGRTLRSTAPGQIGQDDADEDDEEDGVGNGEDSDDGRDYSWKKTIMIGPSYQASVPGGLSAYGDTLPYENEDKLLWNPYLLSEEASEEYLAKSQESLQGGNGVSSLPLGAHIRDDEQALYLLLQCGYNSEEGLRRRRMNAVPPADTMSLWSEDECRAFELGLRLYGKDFHMIQQQKVRTRSVGELVQFYYLWKKTERHDVFANATRVEKKKYTLHPGTTDYMDRFIDETDASRDRSSSPNFHSLLASYGADNKKGLSIMPGSSAKNMQDDNVSNGTATNAADMTSTNNASQSIDGAGVTNSSNGDRSLAMESSHLHTLPVTGSSGAISTGPPFSSSTNNHRGNDSIHENMDTAMENQSS